MNWVDDVWTPNLALITQAFNRFGTPHYTQEDLFNELESGEAHICVFPDDGIMFYSQESLSAIDHVHIILAVSFDGHVSDLGALLDTFLMSLPRAGAVTFTTTRKGWEKVAKRLGFEHLGDGEYFKGIF